jgi:hypothetical protein
MPFPAKMLAHLKPKSDTFEESLKGIFTKNKLAELGICLPLFPINPPKPVTNSPQIPDSALLLSDEEIEFVDPERLRREASLKEKVEKGCENKLKVTMAEAPGRKRRQFFEELRKKNIKKVTKEDLLSILRGDD